MSKRKPKEPAPTNGDRRITNVHLQGAWRALDNDAMFFFPTSVVVARERDDDMSLYAFAVHPPDEDGSAPMLRISEADTQDDEHKVTSVMVTGRHVLEQLRHAIDLALAVPEAKAP